MSYRVLVIDDELDVRREEYQNFAAAAGRLTPNFSIQLDFLDDPVGLPTLANSSYDAFLVDVRLNRWEVNLRDILPIVGNRVPVVLVSSDWDDTNSDDVNYAWARPNCRTFLQWREICDVNSRRAILQMSKVIAEFRRVDQGLAIPPDQPITILHISDLQAGGFPVELTRLEAIRSAEEIRKHSGGRCPDFIAFTGDIAEHGYPSEYDEAEDWLSYFCERLNFEGAPSRRLLFVPGNHDVCVPLVASDRVYLKPAKSEDVDEDRVGLLPEFGDSAGRLRSYGIRPYMEFVAKMSDRGYLTYPGISSSALPWIETRFRHLGVVFYGVNTAFPFINSCFANRRVDPNSLSIIAQEISDDANRDFDGTVVIGLTHHCPVPADRAKAVENPEAFGTFFGGPVRTALALHGHIHKQGLDYVSRNEYRLVLSCAATLSKGEAHRPPGTLRGFSMLQMIRKGERVVGMSGKSFEWRGENLAEQKERVFELGSDGMFYEKIRTTKRK